VKPSYIDTHKHLRFQAAPAIRVHQGPPEKPETRVPTAKMVVLVRLAPGARTAWPSCPPEMVLSSARCACPPHQACPARWDPRDRPGPRARRASTANRASEANEAWLALKARLDVAATREVEDPEEIPENSSR